jgi:hypothetical protein
MSVTAPTEMRQIVDWRAAVWAGGVAGLVFLVYNLFITPFMAGGNAWEVLRL